ncbi:DUF2634 domain-containing protein [Paenibacillus sp. DMB20]|uniref:DUF2634 domain-containing protein n=1 Tax=Paenibacillus sp. DMB20 TaxID=1642570 RepID=UPI000627D97B|nr:DUF2634 domain-containing protein [Paenibacillus sp. DMB20]KKO54510.1 terminase [Paenibacillus sp. DMB20]
MALSPLEPVDIETEVINDLAEEQPLKTYALDFDNGVLGGYVDGLDSIKQFIVKAIKTARFRFVIYDDDYGCELDDLIGSSATLDLLETEIPRVIEEALIYDDRIDDVYDFELTREGDRLYVSFYVEINDEIIPMEVTI